MINGGIKMEKNDRSMFAKEIFEGMNKMKLKGKFLTKEQKMKVILYCYSDMRKQIAIKKSENEKE